MSGSKRAYNQHKGEVWRGVALGNYFQREDGCSYDVAFRNKRGLFVSMPTGKSINHVKWQRLPQKMPVEVVINASMDTITGGTIYVDSFQCLSASTPLKKYKMDDGKTSTIEEGQRVRALGVFCQHWLLTLKKRQITTSDVAVLGLCRSVHSVTQVLAQKWKWRHLKAEGRFQYHDPLLVPLYQKAWIKHPNDLPLWLKHGNSLRSVTIRPPPAHSTEELNLQPLLEPFPWRSITFYDSWSSLAFSVLFHKVLSRSSSLRVLSIQMDRLWHGDSRVELPEGLEELTLRGEFNDVEPWVLLIQRDKDTLKCNTTVPWPNNDENEQETGCPHGEKQVIEIPSTVWKFCYKGGEYIYPVSLPYVGELTIDGYSDRTAFLFPDNVPSLTHLNFCTIWRDFHEVGTDFTFSAPATLKRWVMYDEKGFGATLTMSSTLLPPHLEEFIAEDFVLVFPLTPPNVVAALPPKLHTLICEDYLVTSEILLPVNAHISVGTQIAQQVQQWALLNPKSNIVAASPKLSIGCSQFAFGCYSGRMFSPWAEFASGLRELTVRHWPEEIILVPPTLERLTILNTTHVVDIACSGPDPQLRVLICRFLSNPKRLLTFASCLCVLRVENFHALENVSVLNLEPFSHLTSLALTNALTAAPYSLLVDMVLTHLEPPATPPPPPFPRSNLETLQTLHLPLSLERLALPRWPPHLALPVLPRLSAISLTEGAFPDTSSMPLYVSELRETVTLEN